ncbi:TadE/TadG family type IV pilus assembly protein [Aquihabitans daechungensis]|uniref:TadE/TadG family type IV pilus assembly protein n=1 Tax=Aquihabitans daechungensis TaxID=1052257 RepID=UPI003B9DF28E
MSWASARRRAHRRASGERGAVLVEFALIFPFLAMLMFGMLTGGLVLNRRLAVSQATREGARYGATVAIDQCTPVTRCSGRTWAEQVQSVALSRSGGSVASSANVCVALVEGPGSAPVPLSLGHTTKATLAPCYVDQSADAGRRVQVVITFTDKIEAVMVNVPVTVTSRSTSKLEQ